MDEKTIQAKELTFEHLGEQIEVTFLRNPGAESITLRGQLSKLSAYETRLPPRLSAKTDTFDFGPRKKELRVTLKVGSSETLALPPAHEIRLVGAGD